MDEYGDHARLYDPLVGPFLGPVHKGMVQWLAARHALSVLDVCCGTGLLAGHAQSAGLFPVGADLSPGMLAQARTKHPSISFIETDAAALPMPEGAFDAATISFALHEKPRQVALDIFHEALRVTRPGGSVLVADYRRPVRRKSVVTGWGIRGVERLAGREHHRYFKAFMQAGGTEGFLAEAGVDGQLMRVHFSGWCGVYWVGR